MGNAHGLRAAELSTGTVKEGQNHEYEAWAGESGEQVLLQVFSMCRCLWRAERASTARIIARPGRHSSTLHEHAVDFFQGRVFAVVRYDTFEGRSEGDLCAAIGARGARALHRVPLRTGAFQQ